MPVNKDGFKGGHVDAQQLSLGSDGPATSFADIGGGGGSTTKFDQFAHDGSGFTVALDTTATRYIIDISNISVSSDAHLLAELLSGGSAVGAEKALRETDTQFVTSVDFTGESTTTSTGKGLTGAKNNSDFQFTPFINGTSTGHWGRLMIDNPSNGGSATMGYAMFSSTEDGNTVFPFHAACRWSSGQAEDEIRVYAGGSTFTALVKVIGVI